MHHKSESEMFTRSYMSRGGPHERLRESIASFLGYEPPSGIPRKWERFSNIAILPSGSFEGGEWEGVVDRGLWKAVASGLEVDRLGIMGEVSGSTRDSGVRMLLGNDDWVVRKENGVQYGYNITECMFSAGNVNERRRMGDVPHEGEVIVDLFSGIGYYSLPILLHSGASHVHCCEWNEVAIDSLKWSLERNGVTSRCTIHPGDNRETCKSIGKVADRVIMGLLPSSEESLGAAMEVLSESGGVIHVHGLAKPSRYMEWGEGVATKLCGYRPGSRAEILGINRVKSYAPRWDHVVLDVNIL